MFPFLAPTNFTFLNITSSSVGILVEEPMENNVIKRFEAHVKGGLPDQACTIQASLEPLQCTISGLTSSRNYTVGVKACVHGEDACGPALDKDKVCAFFCVNQRRKFWIFQEKKICLPGVFRGSYCAMVWCISIALSLGCVRRHPCYVLRDLKCLWRFWSIRAVSCRFRLYTVRLWGMGSIYFNHCSSTHVTVLKWTIALGCDVILCVHLGEGGPNHMATGMCADDEWFGDRSNIHVGQDENASDVSFEIV